MDKNAACFTGHRNIEGIEINTLMYKLDETIAQLTVRGVTTFLSGGACGFDQLAAEAVLRAREHNRDIILTMALPCLNQDDSWDEADKKTFRRILGDADHIIYATDQPYADGCMLKRNQLLVERSGVCVAYMKHDRSGTSQTVRLARENGLEIINLAE